MKTTAPIVLFFTEVRASSSIKPEAPNEVEASGLLLGLRLSCGAEIIGVGIISEDAKVSVCSVAVVARVLLLESAR
jgi:hypothetical protein